MSFTREQQAQNARKRWGDPAARFWKRVDKTAGAEACWPWTGGRHDQGYGEVRALGERRAHRVAWLLTFGPIPDGLWVLHRCDNGWCCNPSHFFLGTSQDNTADMNAKGRARGGSSPGERHAMAKLSDEDVANIRATFVDRYGEQTRLARRYGVSLGSINKIVRNKTWRKSA